jgi:hypothetical protein
VEKEVEFFINKLAFSPKYIKVLSYCEVSTMTDARVARLQEAVYMEMEVRGPRPGGVAVQPKKKLEDYCIEQ